MKQERAAARSVETAEELPLRPGASPTAAERTGPAPGSVPPPPKAGRRPRHRPGSTLERLLDVPSRFSFDAAVSVLMRSARKADPGAAVRFRADPGLGFVTADVTAVGRGVDGFTVRTGAIGLTGPGGDLPRPYTELVNDEHRRRSPALAAFLDVLAQRPVAQFAAAGIKYRPHRAAEAAAVGGGTDAADASRDGLREILLALVGYADPGLLARLRPGPDPLLYFSGIFATRPRSAGRLAAVLSDWLGLDVRVEQFSGTWLDIGPESMTALPRGEAGRFNRLGVDAAAGSRAWDVQSRVNLRIGPLSLAAFEALLPGGALMEDLAALAKAYLGLETGFTINPVLAAEAVPAPRLCAGAPVRIGLTAWLPVSGGRREDADDPRFAGDRAAT